MTRQMRDLEAVVASKLPASPAYPAYPPSPVILASSLTAGSGDGGGGTGALHMANPLNSGPTAAAGARRGSTAGLAPGAVAALPRSDTAVLMQIALAMQVGGAHTRQRALPLSSLCHPPHASTASPARAASELTLPPSHASTL